MKIPLVVADVAVRGKIMVPLGGDGAGVKLQNSVTKTKRWQIFRYVYNRNPRPNPDSNPNLNQTDHQAKLQETQGKLEETQGRLNICTNKPGHITAEVTEAITKKEKATALKAFCAHTAHSFVA